MGKKADPRVVEYATMIADNLGDNYAAAHEHKSEWVKMRGTDHNGGQRDINAPFKGDYRAAAEALLVKLEAEVQSRILQSATTTAPVRDTKSRLIALLTEVESVSEGRIIDEIPRYENEPFISIWEGARRMLSLLKNMRTF